MELIRINLYPQAEEDTFSDIFQRTETVPDELLDQNSNMDGPWVVILYNCDCHTFEEVTSQLRMATGCNLSVAWQIAFQAHQAGRAIAYTGSKASCAEVARCLRSIHLQVETDLF